MISYVLYCLTFFLVVSGLLWLLASWASRSLSGRVRLFVHRGLLAVWMLFVMHLVFDLALLGFVRSDGFGRSVSAKLWKHRYWHPVNAQGYRDVDHTDGELASHRVLVALGDSFVAGHGIDSADDRFASILGRELAATAGGGERWTTVILAENGWGPDQELEALQAFGHDPDIVVLGYYTNDVQPACEQLGRASPTSSVTRGGGLWGLHLRKSPFASHLYWRVAQMQSGLGDAYRDWLTACREDPEVAALHLAQIEAIRAESEERGAKFLMLLIPSLRDVRGSRLEVQPLVDALRRSGVPVVDLAASIADRDPRDLVVNELDAHANVDLNREIAALLFAEIQAQSWLDGDPRARQADEAG